MPTVFIGNQAILLEPRFASGDIIDESAANMLNLVKLRRLRARLDRLLSRGEITPDELQTKAIELNNQELVPYLTSVDSDEDDPIMAEALAIAREAILARMAQEDLPIPKGIDDHARALVDAMPDLQEKARLRVEARLKAAQSAISELI